jgi:ATP-binding cassette subfamily B protein
MMAAFGVSTGRITPGDFVLINSLFMQLSGPLHNIGTLFNQLQQSTVDVEDLYLLLN